MSNEHCICTVEVSPDEVDAGTDITLKNSGHVFPQGWPARIAGFDSKITKITSWHRPNSRNRTVKAYESTEIRSGGAAHCGRARLSRRRSRGGQGRRLA